MTVPALTALLCAGVDSNRCFERLAKSECVTVPRWGSCSLGVVGSLALDIRWLIPSQSPQAGYSSLSDTMYMGIVHICTREHL